MANQTRKPHCCNESARCIFTLGVGLFGVSLVFTQLFSPKPDTTHKLAMVKNFVFTSEPFGHISQPSVAFGYVIPNNFRRIVQRS